MFQQVTISVGYVSAYGLQKVNSHEVFCSSLFCSYFSRFFLVMLTSMKWQQDAC